MGDECFGGGVGATVTVTFGAAIVRCVLRCCGHENSWLCGRGTHWTPGSSVP